MRLKIAEQDKIHREKLKKEYKEANPTEEVARKRRWKKFYEKNKERILQNKKEYYQNNKDKFHDYYENNKDKYKEYYQNNKDKKIVTRE